MSDLSDAEMVQATVESAEQTYRARFERNLSLLLNLFDGQVERIVARFIVADNIVKIDPNDIGYYERDLFHISIATRRLMELTEIEMEDANGQWNRITLVPGLALFADDAMTVNNVRVQSGMGAFVVDFQAKTMQVRAVDDTKLDEYMKKHGYPFLFLR
jgi:hypothetical protein